MLKAEHLTKSYDGGKKIALDDFNLDVPSGSIYGLLGPNGAGKTTFIRMVNQISVPDKGRIWMDDKLLSLEHISQIGYMPEERGLYKNMKIGEQIVYFGRLKGMRKSEAMAQAKYWFDKLQIEHWWDKKLSELSKGMAQKIQFVVTVLHGPKLLILDEPFSGFDPMNAQVIKDAILELRAKGTTVMLSTHRMESVEQMCDSVALINKSKKILDGTLEQVRNTYRDNTFLVSLDVQNREVISLLEQKYQIQISKNKADKLEFLLKSDLPQEEIFQDFFKVGRVETFCEKIPSMNEVFILAIS